MDSIYTGPVTGPRYLTAHFTKNPAETWRIFTTALEKAAGRAAAAGYK